MGIATLSTMKIAQIAPLGHRVASYLADELLRIGHDVALLSCRDTLAQRMLAFEEARKHAHRFDVLHFHTGYTHFPMFRGVAYKTVTSLHDRIDAATAAALEAYPEMPLVSLSHNQRRPAPRANWAATVHPGLPPEICPLNPAPPRGQGRYLAYLGRVSPEDGLERAIHIARRANVRLRIGAKIEAGDLPYWREFIAPRLKEDPELQYIGEVDDAAKPALLGHASALLHPAEWAEPFDLSLLEAMSCGTPVIAWPHGASPEVIEDGITGFIVGSIDDATLAADRVLRLDRTRVRARFDERFSAERMTRDYLALYRSLGRTRQPAPKAAAFPRRAASPAP
jgi:glycosyltransferase involved in cell wall biosynthesis